MSQKRKKSFRITELEVGRNAQKFKQIYENEICWIIMAP